MQLDTLERVAHDSSPDSLKVIHNIIADCRALEEAKNHSKMHADAANHLIVRTAMNEEVKSFFVPLIDYI